MSKHFVQPAHMRRAQPILNFVEQDEYGCWLGTCHTLRQLETYTGHPEDYDGCCRVRIQQNTFEAFLKESLENETRYRKTA